MERWKRHNFDVSPSDTTFADALNEAVAVAVRWPRAPCAVSAGQRGSFQMLIECAPKEAWLLVARVARCEVRWFFLEDESKNYKDMQAMDGYIYIYW